MPRLAPQEPASLQLKPLPRPENMSGRGVVVVASGADDALLHGAYSCIATLRRALNCSLPVEIFHIGPQEAFSAAALAMFEDLGGVSIRDVTTTEAWAWAWGDGSTSAGAAPTRESAHSTELDKMGRGYHVKPVAALASSFEEVLLLDADALLFQRAPGPDPATWEGNRTRTHTFLGCFATKRGCCVAVFCSIGEHTTTHTSIVCSVSVRIAWPNVLRHPDAFFRQVGYRATGMLLFRDYVRRRWFAAAVLGLTCGGRHLH